ncbi:MAG: Druantia anti-phage system protein DruA [Planctomycetota bacterium]
MFVAGQKAPCTNGPVFLPPTEKRRAFQFLIGYTLGMDTVITYRGRSVSVQDIATIKSIIAAHPAKSRRFLSQEACRIWNWRQSNGVLKDMVCRSLLLLLESMELITLPPQRCSPPNPLANRKKPTLRTVDQTPIECSVKELPSIRLEQVRRSPLEGIFNSLISQYHYLGYTQPVGEHLKYLAFSHDRPIACLAWSSAPWHIGARDRYIGWCKDIRRKNLHLIANNTRFLVLPWVRVSCVCSHLLALNRKCLSQDWQALYCHPIYLAETFVDTQRYRGTCYRADNWVYVGQTTGRGIHNNSHKPIVSRKAVYVHPSTEDFRRELCCDA